MSIFHKKKSEPEPVDETPKERHLVKKQYKVVGTRYHMKDINKLAKKNPDWKKPDKDFEDQRDIAIYRYDYVSEPLKLVEEDKNKHDKNAVKVMVAGKHVGYIAANEAKEVRDILDNHEIKYLTCWVHGGPFRVVKNGVLDFQVDDAAVKIDISVGYVVEE